ncbi:MAG: DUF3501 family protein [Nitrospirae bacterium]|nr:MAG: DUF3501 family protein [Nitrospirota bacterium]
MKPLTTQDVLSIEEYERSRDAFRQRIIDLKQRRRLSVGNLITMVFENRDTVLFQIQEMIRAERILRPERVREEVDMYNEQIPGAGELSATLMIEVTDPQQVKLVLDRLQGIDRGRTVSIRVGPHLVYGTFEQGRSNEEKISAVHYVRFPVPDAVKTLMEDPAVPVQVVVTHPRYQAVQPVSDEMRHSLLEDLAGGR